MINIIKSLKHWYDIEAAETEADAASMANIMQMGLRDFQNLIANKKVLDLGSGTGRFGIETYVRKHLDTTLESPEQLWSVNIRYSAPDYNEALEQFYEERSKKTFTLQMGTKDIEVPYEEQYTQEEKIKLGVKEAKDHFLSLDWHDLSHFNDESLDIILSSKGFPYYSDLKFFRPQNEEESLNYEGKLITLGSDSRTVFKELARILTVNGKMYLIAQFPQWAWEKDLKSKQRIEDFFFQ